MPRATLPAWKCRRSPGISRDAAAERVPRAPAQLVRVQWRCPPLCGSRREDTAMPPTLRERFQGCLLGLAVGDALGGRFEAQSAGAVRARFPSVAALMAYPDDELWYTDDTQMAIGVAETLVACGEVRELGLCRAFVENYVPSRGYGRGARAVLEAMEEGGDHRAVPERYFPGGSYGNGAAMRVAPVGLFFRADEERLWG